MSLILRAFMEILGKTTLGGVVTELALFAAPLWIAVLVGLVVGWAWRPRWAACLGATPASSQTPELFGLQLGFPRLGSLKGQLPRCITSLIPKQSSSADGESAPIANPKLAVTEEDLKHLCRLVEEKDGGPAWIHMMDRSLPNMVYRAWRRDPESGPPQYRSITVYEDATPEIVRDFFWDDEFRMTNGWDDMLLNHETLEECQQTGTMVVHWIRKFPFFCSDREYTIGRRIWQLGRSYYCITKGVPCSSVPRRNKPRRVDLYYSSWCIRPVESSRGDCQMTACEVVLFHHEDMGIPWEIAKLGVRQGMWGCVKKIEPGLRAYQRARKSGNPLSRCAAMAQVLTKVNMNYLTSLERASDAADLIEPEKQKPWNLPKYLLIGSVVAVACTLDQGLVTKAVIFGVARKFMKIGRRF